MDTADFGTKAEALATKAMARIKREAVNEIDFMMIR